MEEDMRDKIVCKNMRHSDLVPQKIRQIQLLHKTSTNVQSVSEEQSIKSRSHYKKNSSKKISDLYLFSVKWLKYLNNFLPDSNWRFAESL